MNDYPLDELIRQFDELHCEIESRKTELLKVLTDYVTYWDDAYQDAKSELKETCVQYGERAMNGDRRAREHIFRAFKYENNVLTILRNGQTALEAIKTKEVIP